MLTAFGFSATLSPLHRLRLQGMDKILVDEHGEVTGMRMSFADGVWVPVRLVRLFDSFV